MLKIEEPNRRSSEITYNAADLINKDIEYYGYPNRYLDENHNPLHNDQNMYLSLNYQQKQPSKPQPTYNQNSRLFDLRKKYLKNREDQYRRSISHHEPKNRSPPRQAQKCFSPKQIDNPLTKKSTKLPKAIPQPPQPPRNNLRNILKSNFQQVTYEDNPENENLRREMTQLIEIPTHMQSLDMYAFQKTLGQGATAEVRMARHKELDVITAIKIYDKKKMNQQSLKNLNREVEILQSLKHPNIIRLYHSVDSDKQIYLIMEYSSPASLECFMKGRPFKRISEEEAKIIFKQIAEAIDYLHNERILHRDMKLENILIDYQTRKIKVIDFGYSVRLDAQSKQLISCGTPSYMAPEIVKKAPYDMAVDVWSCGIILFRILSGVFPFRGNSEKELNKKILLGKFEYPSFISASAKSLVNQMLKIEPKDRLTMKEVLQHPWMQ